MTYELAKALKDAGFPQPTADSWYGGVFCTPKEAIRGEIEAGQLALLKSEYAYCPTLSELIEACGPITISGVKNKWTAFYWYSAMGSTPEEAVANLWLKSNK